MLTRSFGPIVGLLTVMATAAAAQLTDLGTLPGAPWSYASAVSGRWVAGYSGSDAGPAQAFVWTEEDGLVGLGTLGGLASSALAVSQGQVVGASDVSAGSALQHAFSWTQAGGMVDLGTLGEGNCNRSQARAVSNGQVVGSSTSADGSNGCSTQTQHFTHAFSWTAPGGMVDLGTFGGTNSYAVAVANGQIAGWADTPSGQSHAFSWTPAGGMVDLGAGDGSFALAVDDGQVVGALQVPGTSPANRHSHAFSWTRQGGIVDLGTLGGTDSEALAVSGGHVVGSISFPAPGGQLSHAFSWTQDGGMVDLGTLGGRNSYAISVSGDKVVGRSDTADGSYHAFSWTRAGGMVDLGTLGGQNSSAQAIDADEIVGNSETASGPQFFHAFLLRTLHIDIGSGIGRPGDTADVTVSLVTSGASVAATQNDIAFDPRTFMLDPSDCQPNPSIAKSLTASVVQSDESTRTLRFYVASAENVEPIPAGALYTCTFHIGSSVQPARYPLRIGTVLAWSPATTPVTPVLGNDGSVLVALVLPTPTPTGIATATATPTPSAMPTSSATASPVPCVGDCDDNRVVEAPEIVLLVNIALGSAQASQCPGGVPAGGAVDVTQLIQAVNNDLNGCPAG